MLSLKQKRDEIALLEYKKSIFYKQFSLVKSKKKISRIGAISYINIGLIKQKIILKEEETTKFSFIENYSEEFKEFILNQKEEDKFWFCLGLDSFYGELTDFGGNKKKKDYNLSSTLSRELAEETKNIFDLNDLKVFQNKKSTIENIIDKSPCIVYQENYCIVFIDFTELGYKLGFPYSINHIFKNKETSKLEELENSSLHWIPSSELIKIINKRTPKIAKKKDFHCSKIEIDDKFKNEMEMEFYPFLYEKLRVIIYPFLGIIFNYL